MFGHSISFSGGGKHVVVGAPVAGAVQLFHSLSLGGVSVSTVESEQETLDDLEDEGDMDVESDDTVMTAMNEM